MSPPRFRATWGAPGAAYFAEARTFNAAASRVPAGAVGVVWRLDGRGVYVRASCEVAGCLKPRERQARGFYRLCASHRKAKVRGLSLAPSEGRGSVLFVNGAAVPEVETRDAGGGKQCGN